MSRVQSCSLGVRGSHTASHQHLENSSFHGLFYLETFFELCVQLFYFTIEIFENVLVKEFPMLLDPYLPCIERPR